MNNILFLIPPYFNADDYLAKEKTAVLPAFTVPYGVLSLEAYLSKNTNEQVNIEILDLNIILSKLVSEGFHGNYLDVFKEELLCCLSKAPRIVAVSALFNSSEIYIKDLVWVCKMHDPNIVIVAGGGLPSADYEKTLNDCPGLDAVCKGEGELPLKYLVDAGDPFIALSEYKSWITKNDLAKGKIPQHAFIEDLDKIPFFNYKKIDLGFYNNRSINKKNINENRREMSIHTSRGCPFKCVFCSNPSLHGYDVRVMSVSRVLDDIKRMKYEYGMTDLLIEDDHFFHDIDRSKAILRMLAKIDIRVEFPNGVAVYAINDEIAGLLSQAGVSAVALAVESGSEYVLNNIIKKPLKKKLIKPAIDSLRKHNVRTHVFIVVGLPGETNEHRLETLNMLIENEFDWVHVYVAMPIVGSRLYDICIENGYIKDPCASDFVATKSVIRTPDIDPVEMERYAYETQLMVNFVHNSNMRNGRYDVAIDYLKNVCDKYPGHALGHYYLSKCYSVIGDGDLCERHKIIANEIFEQDAWWRDFRDKNVQ